MIAHITDHAQAGVGLLIEQYKGMPRLEGMLRAYLNRVQELEDAIWSVIIGRLVDYAVGIQLDVLGRLVGQVRNGATDEPYRARIRARIAANRSLGTPDDIIRVALLASALDQELVFYSELQPATVHVELLETDPAIAPAVVELLRVAKAPGVALQLFFTAANAANSFTFSMTDGHVDFDANSGFGIDEDPTTAPGGLWIDSL